MATFKIRSANNASLEQLAPDLPRLIDTSTDSISIQLARVEDLAERVKDAMYKLFDENMSAVSANSSMTYEEAGKREELFDPLSRYILLTNLVTPSPSADTVPMPGALPRSDGKGREPRVDIPEEDLLGYCSFRFDTEETLGSRDAEVVYCYELQLRDSVRGQGLARILMEILEKIGKQRGMSKSILTCLKANEGALGFYTKQGYQPDEIDPTRMAEEESEEEDEDEEWQEVGSDGEPLTKEDEHYDYIILSKNLQVSS